MNNTAQTVAKCNGRCKIGQSALQIQDSWPKPCYK